MKAKEQFKRVISFCSASVMVGLLTAVFAFVWYQVYSDVILFPFYRRGNWMVVLIYVILSWAVSKALGGYKIGYLKRSEMVYSQTISIILVNLITYFQISLIGRRLMAFGPILGMTLIDLLLLLLWSIISSRLYFHIYPARRLIIVYGSKSAAQLVLKMSERVEKYMICESISIQEGMDKIKEELLRFEGVILCDISGAERNDLVKYCFEKSLRAYISPKLSDIILRGAEEIRLFDSPLLLCRNYGLTIEQRFAKRTFDIIASLLGLLLTAPIMAGCALAVKLHDGGAVFYRQTRLTQDGKAFDVLKFRSMIENAEEQTGPQLAEEADGRITPVGKFLRKCRLDELPQLINILRGEMSVVGPRPERPELAEAYEKEIPEFSYRLKVKAGLTGYAQVVGVYDTTPFDKLKMDLMYIERYSMLLDLRIILMTLKTILFPGKTNAGRQIVMQTSPDPDNHSDTERSAASGSEAANNR